MAEDITYKFKSQPICRNCGADVRVEYSPDIGYYSKCEKCGSDCVASPFSSGRDEQDWLYKMFELRVWQVRDTVEIRTQKAEGIHFWSYDRV